MVTAIGQAAFTNLCAASTLLEKKDLRALSPMVILAPHADDETLGCGGLLSIASAEGLQPRVVYLTDGSASHRNSALWSPSRLTQTRQEEALAALAVLGVEAHHACFMNWPDSAPFDLGTPEYQAACERLSAWFKTFNPRSLWAPRRGEGHCDHEAANALADDLCRRAGLRRMDYMVWGWADDAVATAHEGERVWRLHCGSFAEQRRHALACHRTQMTHLISDAEDAFIIPDDLAALVDRPAEIFLERP
jgi:LmbE family N-acetylglucosaminyl deacetylase